MTVIHNIGMFLLGVRDSMSPGWITKVLLCIDKQTMTLHPASRRLFDSLKLSLIQVLLFIFVIPLLLNFIGIYYIAFVLRGLFLLLSYGYLFFYNEQIL